MRKIIFIIKELMAQYFMAYASADISDMPLLMQHGCVKMCINAT